MIASPLETVSTHELMAYLGEYFSREEVELIVVGWPVQNDGRASDPMKPLQFFLQAFKKRFPEIRIEKMDERVTSSLAADALVRGGMKKKDRRKKGSLDKVSAALILQSYLEGRNKAR